MNGVFRNVRNLIYGLQIAKIVLHFQLIFDNPDSLFYMLFLLLDFPGEGRGYFF